MKGELESYCIGCRWWSKGNIDGAVQKILRVEQREKNNGGENKYCWGAKEILFPFSVEQREH